MTRERLLDVGALPPPEPLERILAALATLAAGQYLRVRHSREPYPLYAILDEHGFDHLTRRGRDTPFEILIWRRGDDAAHAEIQRR